MWFKKIQKLLLQISTANHSLDAHYALIQISFRKDL